MFNHNARKGKNIIVPKIANSTLSTLQTFTKKKKKKHCYNLQDKHPKQYIKDVQEYLYTYTDCTSAHADKSTNKTNGGEFLFTFQYKTKIKKNRSDNLKNKEMSSFLHEIRTRKYQMQNKDEKIKVTLNLKTKKGQLNSMILGPKKKPNAKINQKSNNIYKRQILC